MRIKRGALGITRGAEPPLNLEQQEILRLLQEWRCETRGWRVTLAEQESFMGAPLIFSRLGVAPDLGQERVIWYWLTDMWLQTGTMVLPLPPITRLIAEGMGVPFVSEEERWTWLLISREREETDHPITRSQMAAFTILYPYFPALVGTLPTGELAILRDPDACACDRWLVLPASVASLDPRGGRVAFVSAYTAGDLPIVAGVDLGATQENALL